MILRVSMIQPINFPKPKNVPALDEQVQKHAKEVGNFTGGLNNLQNNCIPVSTWHAYSDISFGYSHPLKSLFKEGEFPSVKVGLYGDPLTKATVSLEHIVPHSKGGKGTYTNYALASIAKNNERGSAPLIRYLTKEQATTYLDQFRDIKIFTKNSLGEPTSHVIFDGNKYILGLVRTLKKEGVDVSGNFEDVVKNSPVEQIKSVSKNL